MSKQTTSPRLSEGAQFIVLHKLMKLLIFRMCAANITKIVKLHLLPTFYPYDQKLFNFVVHIIYIATSLEILVCAR